MDASKLFKVLVVGGAMLGASCTEEPSQADAGPGAAADAGPAELDAGSGEPIDCGFCPNEMCCETDPSGQDVTKAGMMCCWGTSC